MPSDLDMQRGFFRRIYAGFIWGKRINRVSMEAEAWFWRINAIADDYGNLPGDPERVFRDTSGRRRVTVEDVAGWVAELSTERLVVPYRAEDDDYLHIVGFTDLQPAAAKNGKRVRRFPASPYDAHQESPVEVLEVNPSESKKIQVDPGESRCDQGIQAHKDYDKDYSNDNDKAKPIQGPSSASAVDSGLTGEQRAVFEYLTLAEVGRFKATELAMNGLTMADARRVNDARKVAGKPADGKFVAQLKAAAAAAAEREKRRRAMSPGGAA